MLLKLGNVILANRLQAILVTSLLSMFGLVVPLFSYVGSGIVPGLVTLRKNTIAGIQVIAGSLIFTLLFAMLVNINPYIVAAFAFGIWIPVWFSSAVLRITASQGVMVMSAGLVGLIYLLLTHLLIDDVVSWWSDWLDLWLEQVTAGQNREKLSELFTLLAPLMNALTVAGLYANLVCTVLCARWWQAHLFNKGGFQKEFHALRLPRQLIYVVIAVVVYMVLDKSGPGSMAVDLVVLLIFLYLFQGIASIHRLVAVKSMSRGWLLVMYVMMLLVPQLMIFMACVGMVNSWIPQQDQGHTNPDDKS